MVVPPGGCPAWAGGGAAVIVSVLLAFLPRVTASVLPAMMDIPMDVARGLTCWTCPNKTDNEACNDWAPDRACSSNHTVCKTVHHVNVDSGRSVAVNKMCSHRRDCSTQTIGCRPTDTAGVQACTSCCDYAYCNEPVPTNQTTALMYSSLVSLSVAPPGGPSSASSLVLLLCCVAHHMTT